MSDWENMANNKAESFRPVSDNSSYFDKTLEARVEKIREEINQQVRNEANQAIHNIVLAKDKEIDELKLKLETKPKSSLDEEAIIYSFTQALKRAEKTDDLNNNDLKNIRDVILKWKEFFEEYKWKSNYISNKIQTLLKETDDML